MDPLSALSSTALPATPRRSVFPTTVPNKERMEPHTRAYLGHITQGSAGQHFRPQWFGGVMDDVQFYTDALDSAAINFLHDHPGEEWSPGVTR